LVAQRLRLDGGLLWTLLQNALKPALHAWRRQLSPLLGGIPWNRGNCPICGAVCLLGELRGNHLAKHLRCGRCGADWPYRRLQCLYCGNEDSQSLGYLSEGQDDSAMRVEVCDKCLGYLKVIVSFDPTPANLLPIEDLATLHLDYLALKRGYARIT
jgi:FdhE protein